MFRSPFRSCGGFLACLFLVILQPGWVYSVAPSPESSPESSDQLVRQIAALDFDDLLDLRVTLATRTPEKWFRSSSAMYVITGEDIRRSGLTLVPELLRLAPGVHVARIDANKWKISIRGFNERFSSKLQILVDGRSVYTPLFSGVYWDIQDLPIEAIDRIEVVRGPGGALWGSNAVNGIINIVTRNAAESQGGLVVGTVGDEETRGQVTGRYGFGGDRLKIRVHGRYIDQDAGGHPQDGIPFTGGSYTPGEEAEDGWQQWHLGFRGDLEAGDRDRVSFFGDVHDAELGQTRVVGFSTRTTEPDTIEASGGYAGLVWQRAISTESDLNLRLFFDHTRREDAGLWEKRNTFTADLQHRFTLGDHEIMWGGDFRTSSDQTEPRNGISFDPADRTLRRGALFVQDRIDLNADRNLVLTFGSRFEFNNFTDFEYQPSARLLWAPSDRTSTWAAVSRAVRAPSRANYDLQLEVAPGVFVPLGNPDLESEEMVAYEAGWRYRFSWRLYLDIAVFLHEYDKLIDGVENSADSRSAGHELSGRWEVTPAWTLACSWSYLDFPDRGPDSVVAPPARHLLGARSYLDLPHDLALDTAFYYTDPSGLDIPAVRRLDLRLGWRGIRNLGLSVSVLNLMDEATPESRGGTRLASDVQRSIHGTARVRF